jgi:hypothetical protein
MVELERHVVVVETARPNVSTECRRRVIDDSARTASPRAHEPAFGDTDATSWAAPLCDRSPLPTRRYALVPSRRPWSSEDLDATGVTVEQGSIVLVHTGRDRRRDAVGPWNTYAEGLAGLDPECARWLHHKDPSVLRSDGVSDVMPGPDPEWPIAIHMCAWSEI